MLHRKIELPAAVEVLLRDVQVLQVFKIKGIQPRSHLTTISIEGRSTEVDITNLLEGDTVHKRLISIANFMREVANQLHETRGLSLSSGLLDDDAAPRPEEVTELKCRVVEASAA